MTLLKVDGFETKRIFELSGGTRRKVELAKAFISQTRVYLLDDGVDALVHSCCRTGHIMDNSIAAMTLEELRQRNALLEQENARLREQVAQLTTQVNWFMEQFELAKHRQFGASSERSVPGQKQLSFLNEAEKEADPGPAEPEVRRRSPWRG